MANLGDTYIACCEDSIEEHVFVGAACNVVVDIERVLDDQLILSKRVLIECLYIALFFLWEGVVW